MEFPVVILKSKEAPLYYFEKDDFGLVSSGGESFYRNGIIYDSSGSIFQIQGIDGIRVAPIFKSLKYFQKMFIVSVKYEKVDKIALNDFKKIFISHIRSFDRYWVKRDLIESLESSIMQKMSFVELLKFIK